MQPEQDKNGDLLPALAIFHDYNMISHIEIMKKLHAI